MSIIIIKLLLELQFFKQRMLLMFNISGQHLKKNSLGSLDFLFHKLIKEIYVNHKYFDFGNSHENGGMQINQGLNYWKEGFGARSLTHDFYEIETSNFKKLDNILI